MHQQPWGKASSGTCRKLLTETLFYIVPSLVCPSMSSKELHSLPLQRPLLPLPSPRFICWVGRSCQQMSSSLELPFPSVPCSMPWTPLSGFSSRFSSVRYSLVNLPLIMGQDVSLLVATFFYTSMGLCRISGELLGRWQNALCFSKIHQVINLVPSSGIALSFPLRVSTWLRVKRTSAGNCAHLLLREKPVLWQIWLQSCIKQLRPWFVVY